jgi:hypothetical protein
MTCRSGLPDLVHPVPRRNNVFALGAGFTIAVAWNCLEFFGPHLMHADAVIFWTFLHTGQVQHLETMMVPIGGIGHFILIIACLAALFNQTTDANKWGKFIAGGVLVLGYFALIIAIARPQNSVLMHESCSLFRHWNCRFGATGIDGR